MKIICPECGRVDRYFLRVRTAKSLIFDENKEPDGETEEIITYHSNTPRCHCGKKVKIMEEDNAN